MKIKWATVAKYGQKSLHVVLKTHAKASIKAMTASGFRAARVAPRSVLSPKPTQIPVYFSNIRRGPIGKLKRSLQESLPK